MERVTQYGGLGVIQLQLGIRRRSAPDAARCGAPWWLLPLDACAKQHALNNYHSGPINPRPHLAVAALTSEAACLSCRSHPSSSISLPIYFIAERHHLVYYFLILHPSSRTRQRRTRITVVYMQWNYCDSGSTRGCVQ